MTYIHSNLRVVRLAFVAGITMACFGFAQSAFALTFGIPDVAGDGVETVQSPEVRVVDSAPRALTLSWASDVRTIVSDRFAASAETEYAVVVYDKKTGKSVYEVSTTDTELDVTGLERNHGYIVEVAATRDGVTSDSVSIVARTAPAAPQRVTAEIVHRQIRRDVITNEPINQFGGSSMSEYLAYLSWKAPEGKVRYYTVTVYEKGSDVVVQELRTKKHFIAIGDLESGVRYEAVVTAHFNGTYESPLTGRVRFRLNEE